jgi:ribonuclease-3
MSIGKEFLLLQNRINYAFADVTLLETALTHTSYSNEKRGRGMTFQSNERLEFLGDAVLQIIVSEYLYENYKERGEGALTKMRQFLVCEKTLAKIASKIELGEYIHLGKGEELTDCRSRPKVLCDAMEALVGAIYLDSRSRGNEAYVGVVLSLLQEEIAMASVKQKGDYKTLLQQLVEKDGMALLEYTVLDESGPEHNKSFTVCCKVNNNVVGTGVAKTKKAAQMQAARAALLLFGVDI